MWEPEGALRVVVVKLTHPRPSTPGFFPSHPPSYCEGGRTVEQGSQSLASLLLGENKCPPTEPSDLWASPGMWTV